MPIYGMIPNAKMDARLRAPPENMLNMSMIVPFVVQLIELEQPHQYQEPE